MRTVLAAIALLISLACFGFLFLFLVVKVWPSFQDFGVTETIRTFPWQALVVLGVASLGGMVFLLIGVSLLPGSDDRPA